MKGRKKEMIRLELQSILKDAFGIDQIHSEYGMTEILSQCYSKENGICYRLDCSGPDIEIIGVP